MVRIQPGAHRDAIQHADAAAPADAGRPAGDAHGAACRNADTCPHSKADLDAVVGPDADSGSDAGPRAEPGTNDKANSNPHTSANTIANGGPASARADSRARPAAAAASGAGSDLAFAAAGPAEMKEARSRIARCLGIFALLPLFGLVFWGAATVAGGLPGLVALAVNVHGLGIPSYAAGSGQRPAPVSVELLLRDAYGDAIRPNASNPHVVGSQAPFPSPTPGPPLPLPTAIPLPTPTPAPTPTPGTIAGQVLDSQTLRPIAAATVSVSPTGPSAVADANGNFSITVNPGSYTLTASSPTYNSASQTVTVAGGQKATVAFRLTSIAAFGSLTGRVIDGATRAPIAGATVTLSNGLIRTTDLNGNFSYSIVLNGTYTLTVSAVGYVTQSKAVTITPNHTTYVQIVLAHASQRLG
jgi:hypothetical protein